MLPPPPRPQWNGARLRAYRTKMGQEKSPEAVREAVQWLNEAGVGRYDVGGQPAERVPNASGALGAKAIALREAFAELSYDLKSEELTTTFETALKDWREAASAARGAV